jgi:hypothetical protein
LAAAAPKPLVAAIRRQRNRPAMTGLAADAPAPRVRRALATLNGLLVGAVSISSVVLVVNFGLSLVVPDYAVSPWDYPSNNWTLTGFLSLLAAFVAATISWAVSAVAGRRRGTVLGSGLSILLIVALPVLYRTNNPASVMTVELLVEPLLALIWTFVVLSRRFESRMVPWARFRRRSLVMFVVSIALVALTTLVAILFPNDQQAQDSSGPDALEMITVCFLLAAFSIALAAAYAGGVRIVPLTAGDVVVFSAFEVSADPGRSGPALLLLGPALAVVAGFILQLRRFRDRPPLEFWETRKRPLLVGVPGATTWILSNGDFATTAWFFGIPAAFALLNAGADRFGAFVARHRLDARSPFHLD